MKTESGKDIQCPKCNSPRIIFIGSEHNRVYYCETCRKEFYEEEIK